MTKGKGKTGKGGKGKGKGKGKKKGLFTELPEEKQQEIYEAWAARAAREGRVQNGSASFTGTVLWRCRGYGWIVPSDPDSLPKKVKAAMATMTAEMRAKAEEKGSDTDKFDQDVLYFRTSDRTAMDATIDKFDQDVLYF